MLFADTQRTAGPLIMPQWHQTDPWNARCPGQGQNRAHAGSHALALAKTMKYWAYPNRGQGSVSYTDDDFGVLNQSFDQDINWGGMSNTLVFQTTQRFIYTCGLATLTDYEYDYSSSSLANVRTGMINYFRYDSSMHIEQRSAYTNFVWKNMLRNELDNHRVAIYSVFMSDSREIAFIVDGYDEAGLFHINYSNEDIPDAWVELNELSLFGETIPAANQQMLIGIQPSLGPVSINENFEDGFGHHNWQFSGNSEWTISSEAFYFGSHSAKSGNIDHNQSSSMYLVIDVAQPDSISFYKRVSCESEPNNQYDHLAFFIDGVEMERWSGDGSWEYHEYPVGPGVHEFRWTYSKDGASVYYSDCGWIDALTFPEGSTPLGEPRFLEAEVVNDNDVRLDWMPPSPVNPGLTGYRVYRDGLEISQFMNPVMTSYTDPNLPNGEYSYYLRALYSSGLSNPGNTASVSVEHPYAPQNLSAAITGINSVELNWDAPPLIRNRALLGYYLYRNDAVLAQIENPEATSYSETNLEQGTYYYQVSALYEVGESELSNTAMVALGVPEPPGNLQAVVNGSSVTLSWDQVTFSESLTAFKILRNGIVIATITDPLQLGYVDENLHNGNYSYTVRAIYSDTESADSAAASVLIEVPYAPQNLSAVVDNDDVQLSWDMPDQVRALTHYFIYRNDVLIAGVFNPNATMYTDLNLANGSYEYRISAIYSGLESPSSNIASALVEVLYPPRNLLATETEPGSVLISWQHPAMQAGRAYLGTNLYINGELHESTIAPTLNSIVLTLPGADYLFEIAALYSSGESVRIDTTLSVQGWLEPVSAINYSVDQDSVLLSWPAVAEPLAIYHLYRNGQLLDQTTALSFSDTALANGYYEYYIIVQHPRGFSEPSPTVVAEVEVLYPPTALQAITSENDVNLSWIAAASSGALNRSLLGYRIWRNNQEINPSLVSDTSYVDSDLRNGSYNYQVAAVYSSGTSELSNSAQASIAVMYPPHSLSAETLGGVVTLFWEMDLPLQDDFIAYRLYKDGSILAETDSTDYEDWGLAPGTYQYQVTALYSGGESLPTQTLSVDLDYIFIPTLLTAELNGNSVQLQWAYVTPLPGIVITGYELWRNDSLLTTQDTNLYIDENLANGDYQYYVKVIYVHGASAPSNVVDVNIEIPYPPRDLSATVSGADINLNWVAPVTGPRELLSYRIYRDGALIGTSAETSYPDPALANGNYTYYVSALYTSGESPASNTISLDVEVTYPPQNLQATVLADTVNLSWDAPANAPRALQGYNIYRDNLVIGQSTELSYSDATLPNGSFTYHVTALYDSGESLPGNSVNATVEVPYPPRNLSASSIADSVYLSWDLPATSARDLMAYMIYRNGLLIGQSEELGYGDNGLANGAYTYHVTAIYSSGESLPSNTVQVNIEVAYPPLGLTAMVELDTVLLTWQLPATSLRALQSYKVYRDGVLIGQGTELSFSDAALPNGSYTYHVTALYDSGESPASNAVLAEVEVPYPPRNLSGTVSGTEVNLNWLPPQTAPRELLSYYIYRNDVMIGSSTETMYLDSGMANGSYTYYVSASYSSGESPASNAINLEVEITYPPQNLQANVLEDTINLSWDVPASAPRALINYNLYRDGVFLGQSSTTSYSDSLLANGSYSYHVTALYDSGESPASNTVSATVEVPYPVTQLTASVESDNVLISWNPPATSNLRSFNGYLLYRNGNLHQILSDPSITEWLDAGLANGNYSYYILARYDAGLSLPSNTVTVEVNVMPDLFPPQNLSLILVGERSARLSWDAPAGLPQFYRIYRNNQEIATATQRSYLDSNLPNGAYEYFVKAQYAEGLSSASNTVNLNLMIAYPPQSFAGNLISPTQVELSWLAPNQGEIGYILHRNGAEYALINNPANTSFTDAELSNGTYSYRVAAIYPDAISSFSPSLDFDVEVLYPPQDFSLLQDNADISLSWTAPIDIGGWQSYRLYRNSQVIYEGSQNTYLDVSAANGNYEYSLGAVYSFGEILNPQILSASIQVAYPATDFNVSLQDDSAILSWNHTADTGFFENYKIYRNGLQIATTTDSTFIDASLANGTYSYQVIAAYSFADALPTESIAIDLELLYPPTGLSAILSEDDIQLSWTPPASQGGLRNLVMYLVHRNSAPYTYCYEPAFTDTSMANGSHNYNILAVYDSGVSAPTPTLEVNLMHPHTPLGFTAMIMAGHTVVLGWEIPNQGETGYLLYRNGSLLASIDDPSVNNFQDLGLSNGSYSYYLIALYGDLQSAPTAELDLIINYPYPPTNLNCTGSENDVQLEWDAPSDLVGFSEYLIFVDNEQLATTDSTTFWAQDISNGIHHFLVKSRYGDDISIPSNTETVQMQFSYPVQNFSGDNEYSALHLSWDPPVDTYQLLSYNVYENGALVHNTSLTEYFGSLSDNGDYSYHVTAQYDWGESEPSTSYDIRIIYAYPPRLLSGSVMGNDVSLNWLYPVDTGFLSKYKVYRNDEMISESLNISFTDEGLANGEYTYYVTAVFDSLESPASESCILSVLVPQAPQNTSLSMDGNNVQISWDPIADSYLFQHYRLTRDDEIIWEGEQNSYYDPELPNGEYHYQVSAVYEDAVSEPSEELVARVILPYPLQDISYTQSGNSITINWQAPQDSFGFSHVQIMLHAYPHATVSPAEGNSYTMTDLDNGYYLFTLRSVYEGDVYVESEATEVQVIVAYSPTNFQAEVNEYSVSLSWAPPADMQLMSGYRLICNGEAIDLSSQFVSYNMQNLPNGVYHYSLQSVYGDQLSQMLYATATISQIYPVQYVSVSYLEDACKIEWLAPLSLFEPDYYEVHLLAAGASTPPSDWILLEGNCTELFYLDSEHGGIDYGIFVWAVTAKWHNATGGIPVLSNPLLVERPPQYNWLVGNYPNPFNPSTRIHFWLKEDCHVRLDVYNSRGQKVRTLVNETLPIGQHDIVFDGTDDNGRSLASGVYFTRMQSGKYHRVRKMVLSK